MDEGLQILHKLNSKESEEVAMKPPLCTETFLEDKGNLTYQLHSRRWQQVKMHF